MEKYAKAEQILQKHQQISQQHKMYKEQKDKLIQAVKSPNWSYHDDFLYQQLVLRVSLFYYFILNTRMLVLPL